MYCIIQEIELKKVNSIGECKYFEVYEDKFTFNNITKKSYKYLKSEERYERTIKTAYKISIHESWREKGKILKKQKHICNIKYYDITDGFGYVGDYLVKKDYEEIYKMFGIDEEELIELIYAKYQDIIDKVKKEFEETEEYKAIKEHKKITDAYYLAKNEFASLYEADMDEYDRIYDVFGNLLNEEYLNQIKRNYESRKKYEQNSSRYYKENKSNYGYYNDYSSMNVVKVYDDSEKDLLKKFYRALSKMYHPDSNAGKDTTSEMLLLNKLKEEWNV